MADASRLTEAEATAVQSQRADGPGAVAAGWQPPGSPDF
jgi:hypothetical protein